MNLIDDTLNDDDNELIVGVIVAAEMMCSVHLACDSSNLDGVVILCCQLPNFLLNVPY